MKNIFIILLLYCIASSAQAGLHNLTHHSRANCINNETISWHLGHSYWVWLNSRHTGNGQDHQVIADWTLTWRGAAVHWGEGRGGWTVEGNHWMKNQFNQPVLVSREIVTDCSIYDGWWDHIRGAK